MLSESILNKPAQCGHSRFSILTLSRDFDDRILCRSEKQHTQDALRINGSLPRVGPHKLNLASEGSGESHKPCSASCVQSKTIPDRYSAPLRGTQLLLPGASTSLAR
jgi:hypothetical protein